MLVRICYVFVPDKDAFVVIQVMIIIIITHLEV